MAHYRTVLCSDVGYPSSNTIGIETWNGVTISTEKT